MIHDCLKSADGSIFIILADTSKSDIIGCNYLYVHSSALDESIVSSPTGETFKIDVSDFKKQTPSDYVGSVEIKCITSI